MGNPLKFYECGSCGFFHPATFYGDCRDDNNRFTIEEAEQYGIAKTGGLPDIVWFEDQED